MIQENIDNQQEEKTIIIDYRVTKIQNILMSSCFLFYIRYFVIDIFIGYIFVAGIIRKYRNSFLHWYIPCCNTRIYLFHCNGIDNKQPVYLTCDITVNRNIAIA